MPEILVERVLPHEKALLFSVLRRVEELGRRMPNILEARVLSENEKVSRARWRGFIEMGGMRQEYEWEEEDFWYPEEGRVVFRMVSGNMRVYEGEVLLEAQNGSTRVQVRVRYDLGIPLLGGLLQKVVQKVVRENLEAYLDAVTALARQTA